MDTNPQPDDEVFGEAAVGTILPPPEDDDGEDNSWKRGPRTDDGDVENQGEDPEEVDLDDAARRARWQSRRPKISHLKDGVVRLDDEETGESTAVPLFDIGDRIVVDRRTNLIPGEPWLDTVVGRVYHIDDDSGLVVVLDEESDPRLPMKRYFGMKNPLQTFKLAPPRGNPFNTVLVRAHLREEAAKEAAIAANDPNAPKKRGRGRPAGVKNRPKEVIRAEREAYRKMMEEKRAKRGRR